MEEAPAPSKQARHLTEILENSQNPLPFLMNSAGDESEPGNDV